MTVMKLIKTTWILTSIVLVWSYLAELHGKLLSMHRLPGGAMSVKAGPLQPEPVVSNADPQPQAVRRPLSKGDRVTGDRAKKLYELVGVEIWPAILAPADGVSYRDEEVLQAFPFLVPESGELDATLVAQVQQAMNRLQDARTKSNQARMVHPFASSTTERAATESLYALLRPLLGWKGQEKTRHAVPSVELADRFPETTRMREARFAQLMTVVAVTQTQAERHPDALRYVSDLQRFVGQIHGVGLSFEQATFLLNSPLERLVRDAGGMGG